MRVLLFLSVSVVVCAVSNASEKGDESRISGEERWERSERRLLVTAAHVSTVSGEAEGKNGANPAVPEWVAALTQKLGATPIGIGTWQELPDKDPFDLYITDRLIITCRIVQREMSGRVVVEIGGGTPWGKVNRTTLTPANHPRDVVWISPRDCVAIRYGWEGEVPPPIFARAVIIHRNEVGGEALPRGIPSWLTEVLYRQGAKRIEDVGYGRWLRLGASPISLGRTSRYGEVMAQIAFREPGGRASVRAFLPEIEDDYGHPVQGGGTVSPVCPGNEHPGTLARLRRGRSSGPEVVVLLLHGGVYADDSGEVESGADGSGK